MRKSGTKFEGWCKYFSPFKTCESTETGVVTQRSLYRDLFNQNGMDFVSEISFFKTPVADEKMFILATDRGSKSAREII